MIINKDCSEVFSIFLSELFALPYLSSASKIQSSSHLSKLPLFTLALFYEKPVVRVDKLEMNWESVIF